MKTAAAYIRVSTDDQVELSPDSQLKQIKEYAKKNGYTVPDEYVFRDEGISGRSTAKRPEFNRMIGTAKTKPKPFEAILLWKFSRFARNREDSIVYKSMLRKQCGISVISISESLGDDKMSVLIEALIEAMDEYYSINLAEEVRRGMLEKISRGGLVSSAPMGYDVINGELAVNEQEAEVVRYIFGEYLQGTPMVTIARNLNANGARTKQGNTFENRVIKYILQNPAYIGKHRWCKDGKSGSSKHYAGAECIIYNGKHKPIISEADFERVQERLSLNKYHLRETVRHANMLRGLIKCHTCGKSLTMSFHEGDRKYLQCSGYSHGFCDVSHHVPYGYVCDMVIATLQKVDYATISKKLASPAKQDDKIAELKKQITRAETKLARCKEAYQNGIDTISEYKDNKTRILTEIKAIQKEIDADGKPDKKQLGKIKSKIDMSVKKLLSETLSDDEKNMILKQIIDKVVYNNETNELDVWFKS